MNIDKFGLGGNNAKSQNRGEIVKALLRLWACEKLVFILLESASGLKVTSDRLLRCNLLSVEGEHMENRETSVA